MSNYYTASAPMASLILYQFILFVIEPFGDGLKLARPARIIALSEPRRANQPSVGHAARRQCSIMAIFVRVLASSRKFLLSTNKGSRSTLKNRLLLGVDLGSERYETPRFVAKKGCFGAYNS